MDVKKYLFGLVSLLIALVVLHQLLKLGKKAPVVGGVLEKAEELAFEG